MHFATAHASMAHRSSVLFWEVFLRPFSKYVRTNLVSVSPFELLLFAEG